MIVFKVFAAALLLFLTSCQLTPTKLYEYHEVGRPDYSRPIVLSKKTVVIDTRSPFNFLTAHLPKSLNLVWQDFSITSSGASGLLAKDMYFHARRLARLGISPTSEVVVIGNGNDGAGEEGRLAWTLLYLGVKNVRSVSHRYFRKGWINSVTTKPIPSVPSWKPKFVANILVESSELSRAITGNSGGYYRHSITKSGGSKDKNIVFLDVRDQEEMVKTNFIDTQYDQPDIGAVHISWKEFFTQVGLPNKSVLKKLKNLKLKKTQRIIVISNKGVRSAAVTMVLLDFGYSLAGNYAGGITELVARR